MRTTKRQAPLDDVVKRSEEHSTFEVPPYQVRTSLKPGNFAKVVACGERFWVLVTAQHEGTFIGRVANVTVDMLLPSPSRHGYQAADELKFTQRNVLDVGTDEVDVQRTILGLERVRKHLGAP